MKIILNEKEMAQLNEYWRNVKATDHSKETQDMLEEAENAIADIVTRQDNGNRVFEIEEKDTIEALKATCFIMEETRDAAVDLVCATKMMKHEGPFMIKLAGKIMNKFITGNRFTRNFWNSLQYYIASMQNAYNQAKATDFSKEESEDEVLHDDPREIAKEQWGVL